MEFKKDIRQILTDSLSKTMQKEIDDYFVNALMDTLNPPIEIKKEKVRKIASPEMLGVFGEIIDEI